MSYKIHLETSYKVLLSCIAVWFPDIWCWLRYATGHPQQSFQMHRTEHFWSSCWNPKHHPRLGPQFQQSAIAELKSFFISTWTAASGSFKVISLFIWLLVCLHHLGLSSSLFWSLVALACFLFHSCLHPSVSLPMPWQWPAAFSPDTECTLPRAEPVSLILLNGMWGGGRKMFHFSLNEKNVRLFTVTKTPKWNTLGGLFF